MSQRNTPTSSSRCLLIQDTWLLTSEQVQQLLQLDQERIEWLVSTGQLNPLRIAGEVRFDSRELNALINTYHQVAKRKTTHAE